MVRHGTARQKFCSYKAAALQVEPRSNSNFFGSARCGAVRLIKRALAMQFSFEGGEFR